MILKEIYLEDDIDSIYAISLVKDGAIEKDFIHFKKKKQDQKYYYTLKPEYAGEDMIVENSHPLCKTFAHGESIEYSIKDIRSWSKFANNSEWGFKDGAAAMLASFDGNIGDLNSILFNCRHMLKPVMQFNFRNIVNFQQSTKPRRITGPVMIANKLILRPPEELDGVNWGYVWYSNETLEKYYKKWGKKSNSTFLHELDITNYMILTKSWINKDNPKQWEWWVEYHVMSDFIWNQIVDDNIKAFSVEMVGKLK